MFIRYTFILCLCFWALISTAKAATPNILSEGSLAISPFLIETTVAPGQSFTDTITVFNVTDYPLPISISINDFVPSGEHGSVRFLDTGEQSHPSFSLASWITITNQPEFTIPPKGETKVTFTINVPVDAEPGSHYGGLLFSAASETLDAVGTKVIKKVGALILVATGKTDASGTIEQFSSNKKFYIKPEVIFTSTFANTGNVHIAPKGQVEIKNMLGKTMGEAHLNENAQFVLPQTSRGFDGIFKNSWMFGRYTANLTYNYGNPKLEAHASISFWVLPIKQLGLIAGIIVFITLLIHLYNRW